MSKLLKYQPSILKGVKTLADTARAGLHLGCVSFCPSNISKYLFWQDDVKHNGRWNHSISDRMSNFTSYVSQTRCYDQYQTCIDHKPLRIIPFLCQQARHCCHIPVHAKLQFTLTERDSFTKRVDYKHHHCQSPQLSALAIVFPLYWLLQLGNKYGRDVKSVGSKRILMDLCV